MADLSGAASRSSRVAPSDRPVPSRWRDRGAAPAELDAMFGKLLRAAGPLKAWKLVAASKYAQSSTLARGNVVLQLQTAKDSFAIILTRTKSGDYRATRLAH